MEGISNKEGGDGLWLYSMEESVANGQRGTFFNNGDV